MREAKDSGGYGAVVVGSVVRMGRWLPEASSFLKNHRAALERMPLALFTVCLTMQDPTEKNVETVEGYVTLALANTPGLKPAMSGLFAGCVDYSKLNLGLLFAVQRFMKIPEGDYRNWAAIREWAETTRTALLDGQPARA